MFHILNDITHIVENTHQKVKDFLSLLFASLYRNLKCNVRVRSTELIF